MKDLMRSLTLLSVITSLFVACVVCFVLAAHPSRADRPSINVVPAQVSAGIEGRLGTDQVFQWTIQVRSMAGTIETRKFLISADELFKFHQSEAEGLQRYAQRLYHVGAVEALWKGGHVGMGFEGVQFGEDRNLGYTDLIKTGFYALVNVILNDSASLNIHTAYEWETMRINLGPQLERNLVDQSVDLKWHHGRWSGQVTGHVGTDTSHMFDPSYLVGGAEVGARFRIGRLSQFDFGADAQVSYEHDGLRELEALMADNATIAVAMDIAWVRSNEVR
jgi:hypothetical protein